MTGATTNDKTALQKADVGLSMGLTGADSAIEAAGIVLLDDNFATIITTVKYGRNILESVRKIIQFQLTAITVLLSMTLLSALFLKDCPFNSVQILWVCLIIDLLAAIALAT